MPALLTTVPDVLNALLALGATSLGAGVAVIDGAPDVDNLPGEFLCIGYSRDEEEASVDGSSTDEGDRTSSETYQVHCILSVATGDTGPGQVAARRARCSALFTAFASGLRADPTLGGTLAAGATALLGTFSWIYGPSVQGGTYSEVEFDVTVSASYLGAT
jgi:hypothetical protein